MLLSAVLIVALATGSPEPPVVKPAIKPAVAQTPQPNPKLLKTALRNTSEDPAAENEILKLANHSRAEAGLSPLRMDDELSAAAREHALRMAANEQLSHQFAGEPALLQRISRVSSSPMDRAGENVAYNSSPEGAHMALMQSPPHRHNLLDPGFNVAGIAALWNGGRLYVVQDFGHELPAYSAQQTRGLVVKAISDVRHRAGLPRLTAVANRNLDDAVCNLAQQGRLDARALKPRDGRGIVTFSQSNPETLPAGAVTLLQDRGARQYEIGTCYARSKANLGGMYWIAIQLY